MHGDVVDLKGRAVAGATERLVVMDMLGAMTHSEPPSVFVVTPDRMDGGRFEFPPLGQADASRLGPAMMLDVRAEGFLRARILVRPGDAAPGPLSVSLQRTGNVCGRCVDARGRPVEGTAVRWMRCADRTVEPLAAPPAPVATGGDGRFEGTGVPESGGTIRVEKRGFGAVECEIPAFEAARGGEVGDLVLPNGVTLRGRVVDLDDAPVAGASVELDERGRRARTDADGRFTMEDMPPPPWYLMVQEHPPEGLEGRSGDLSVTRVPAGELRIPLSGARHVRVEITFAPGKEPELRKFWTYVNLRRAGSDRYESTQIHWGRTRFRLTASRTGAYEVVLEAGEFGRVVLPVDVGTEREAVVRAVLPAPEGGG